MTAKCCFISVATPEPPWRLQCWLRIFRHTWTWTERGRQGRFPAMKSLSNSLADFSLGIQHRFHQPTLQADEKLILKPKFDLPRLEEPRQLRDVLGVNPITL